MIHLTACMYNDRWHRVYIQEDSLKTVTNKWLTKGDVDFSNLVELEHQMWVNLELLSGYTDGYLIFKHNNQQMLVYSNYLTKNRVLDILMKKELLGV